MIQLIGVLVTAAVTLISSKGWPTLRRRIREHAALLKDLPPEAAKPLVELLEREVQRLATRDARFLHPLLSRWLVASRVGITAGVAGMLGAMTSALLSVSGYVDSSPGGQTIFWLLTGATGIAALVALVASMVSHRLVRQYEREHVGHRARLAQIDRDVRDLEAALVEGRIDQAQAEAERARLLAEIGKIKKSARYGVGAAVTSRRQGRRPEMPEMRA